MTGGIVRSLEILDTNQGMGDRGSKSEIIPDFKNYKLLFSKSEYKKSFHFYFL